MTLEVRAMIRVLIADDHAVVRQGLRTFLELQDDIEVVGEAADGERGGRRSPSALAPDVVLMDLVMPRRRRHRGDPRGCASARPRRALVLTSFADDDKVFPAVRAGAAGYLLKDVQPQELASAIRTVHARRGAARTRASRVAAARGGSAGRRRARPDAARARGARAARAAGARTR